MSKATHTPGEWKAHTSHYLKHAAVTIGEEVSITIRTRQTEADARLIAAAPELLEALKRLTDNVEEGEFVSITRINEARAAIAKATGSAA